MTRSLDVLVPQGRDAFIDYECGVPSPACSMHAPINFHAMAAATGGKFHPSEATIPGDGRVVLVLIPRRADRALAAVEALKSRGHRVLITWKECGDHQLAKTWQHPDHGTICARLNGLVDAWLAASPAARRCLAEKFPQAKVIEMPTPYPIDLPSWQSWPRPAAVRSGIFIGTREWEIPARRHAEAITIALEMARRHASCRITVVHAGGWSARWKLWRAAAGVKLHVLAPMPYPRYLEEMASHRLVLQRDASGVPGQVAGDALLAGVPCLGGGGMIDSLAFEGLPGADADDATVMAAADRLLTDATHNDETMAAARARSMDTVSFAAFRKLWAGVLDDLANHTPNT